MKIRLLIILLGLVALSSSAFAQDPGDPDTVMISFSHTPDVENGDSLVVIDITWWTDEQVNSGGSGYGWTGPDMELDSAVWSTEALIAFNLFKFEWANNNQDSTNSRQKFQVSGFGTNGLPLGGTLMIQYFGHVNSFEPLDTIRVTIDPIVTLGWTDALNNEFAPAFGGDAVFGYPQSVEINGTGTLPGSFDLNQNYPNPFNPSTTIKFDLPVAGQVDLTVFNVLGQKVATLVDEVMPADSYSVVWDGHTDSGNKVSSGIYFYRLSAGDYVQTKKMMMLK